ncbi:MAG: hypothetical protein MJA27_35345, partial [Pseudanabaenales cyanobacterium]|nr:hypothetical protein [Pseudanabaenales cyanobacterium]
MKPFLYQYLVGGTIFAVGLALAARQRQIGFKGAGLRNLIVCVAVFLLFFLATGYLQFAEMPEAPARAYDGGADHVVNKTNEPRGAPIDYAIMIGYFAVILVIGTWFGRRQKTTKDFFFGGQRFSWWLITFSLIATTVGSYSF